MGSKKKDFNLDKNFEYLEHNFCSTISNVL